MTRPSPYAAPGSTIAPDPPLDSGKPVSAILGASQPRRDTSKICAHGNNPKFGICPDCANDAMAKRQRKLDRARTREQFARILGRNWRPMS